MGPSMNPPAFDLTGFEFSETFLWRVIREGVPGTEMPAWRSLSGEEVREVVGYISSLEDSSSLPADKQLADPEVLQEAGRRVYAMHCVRCHGVNGDGQGPEAAQYVPRPCDFTVMRPSYEAGRRVIRNGVTGSAMPGWPLLTEAEIQAVTHYIRSLYRWPERHTELSHNKQQSLVHHSNELAANQR